MSGRGLLIDDAYCTSCHSCEVACRQEHGHPVGKGRISLMEIIATVAACASTDDEVAGSSMVGAGDIIARHGFGRADASTDDFLAALLQAAEALPGPS